MPRVSYRNHSPITMAEVVKTLPLLMKLRRGAKSLGQAAKDSGISKATYYRIEDGQTPSADAFAKLADWIGIYATFADLTDRQET